MVNRGVKSQALPHPHAVMGMQLFPVMQFIRPALRDGMGLKIDGSPASGGLWRGVTLRAA
jgi:hypothetical protein